MLKKVTMLPKRMLGLHSRNCRPDRVIVRGSKWPRRGDRAEVMRALFDDRSTDQRTTGHVGAGSLRAGSERLRGVELLLHRSERTAAVRSLWCPLSARAWSHDAQERSLRELATQPGDCSGGSGSDHGGRSVWRERSSDGRRAGRVDARRRQRDILQVGVSIWDCLHLPGNRSRKIDNTYALGRTVAKNTLLNRGTPTPDDDVPVLAGQAWVTVSSLQEGISHVTAFAPDVYGWDARRRTAQIHWVDAVWAFPPPAVNPVGTRHVFTTSVARQSDQTPIEGWRVRYEIVGGPAAAFAPDGSQVREVTTNDLGQASVEIYQTAPAPGVNTVNVRIVRPVLAGRSDRSLTIASTTTQKTWTTPSVSLRKFGPAQASVGATATYRIELSNPGATTVRDLLVTDQLPPGMTFLSSNPPAQVATGRLEWRVPEIGPQQQVNFEIQLRVDQPGTINSCANVSGPSGVAAQDCVTTTVMVPSLDVSMTGPERARVGDEVTFEVTITNRGDLPATNLLILDRYDEGFAHATGANPIERDLEDLSPGASHRIGGTLHHPHCCAQ